MSNYAVIENDKVVNVIVADSKEVAEQVTNFTCIEYTETNPAYIGWNWNGIKFTDPTAEAPTE